MKGLIMTKLEFDREIQRITGSIQELPDEIKLKLIELAEETIDRHSQIVENCDKARKGAETLTTA